MLLTLGATLPVFGQLSPPPSPEAVKLATEPTPPGKLSAGVAQEVSGALPKYSPSAAEKPTEPEKDKPAALEGTTDPEVLHLKKVTVTPKKRPRLTDNVMMTTKGFNEKLAKEKLSSLDRNVLNKFTLPSWFGGVAAAERARDEYDRDQRAQMASDVAGLAKVVEVSDPEQAKALREAAARP